MVFLFGSFLVDLKSYDKDKYMTLLVVSCICPMLLTWNNVICMHKLFHLPLFFFYCHFSLNQTQNICLHVLQHWYFMSYYTSFPKYVKFCAHMFLFQWKQNSCLRTCFDCLTSAPRNIAHVTTWIINFLNTDYHEKERPLEMSVLYNLRDNYMTLFKALIFFSSGTLDS